MVKSCTAADFLSPNPNTPQSPAATAPLFKRGQPIQRPIAVRKEKLRRKSFVLNGRTFRLEGSDFVLSITLKPSQTFLKGLRFFTLQSKLPVRRFSAHN